MTKRIIDKRVKEKFIMDDAYLNGQARICGWQATLVYNSLCRHANINQESFPSIKLIMEELRIGRNTTLKGLENLEKYNVIKIDKSRAENGKWINNTYTLLDKSVWIRTGGEPGSKRGKYHRVPNKDMVSQVPDMTQPSPSYAISQVPVRDTKETHRKEGNTYKETHIPAFEKFWETYPRKELKKKTIEIWKKHKLDNLLPKILEFIEKAKQTDRWKKGYIKQPPAFLNGECWEDDLNSYNDHKTKAQSLTVGNKYDKYENNN